MRRADASDLDAKMRLAVVINALIAARQISRRSAAKLLGVNQANVLALTSCRLDEFSVGRLMGFLLALGQYVVIGITRCLKPRPIWRFVVQGV